MKIKINGHELTIEAVIKVAREHWKVEVDETTLALIEESQKQVQHFVDEGRPVYGINTGFGKFAEQVITKDDTSLLQHNLIVSHACGVGNHFSEEVVRAMMLLRLNSLAQGYSGITLNTFNTLLTMLNRGVYPVVFDKGSLGASGDLVPLSHLALVMLGLGEAYVDGRVVSGAEALANAGIQPVKLQAKEGLALINGTQAMCAVGCLTLYDALQLAKLSDVAVALSMEALRGVITAYDAKVHQLRPHPGQLCSASNVRNLLQNSQRVTKQGELRNQDAYTLRCAPVVHGASKDAFRHVRAQLEVEINSVTDNPLIFPEEHCAISGGNFHGQSVAMAFDYLGIAIAELANISERRLEKLINPAINHGLPAFLSANGGLNSGFMIVQYSAAALVSENKILAHPASVDSIPSSGNQEDHVSMGTIAARKAQSILMNAYDVLAMEIMAATQAIEMVDHGKLGLGTQLAYQAVRNVVPFIKGDIVMYPHLQALSSYLKTGDLIKQLNTITMED